MKKTQRLEHFQCSTFREISNICARIANSARQAHLDGRPWGMPIYLRACKVMMNTTARADAIGFEIWKHRSGFPNPLWSKHLNQTTQEAGISLASVFSLILTASNTPWDRVECHKDFRKLFLWKAYSIAGDPLCSLAVPWIISHIPQHAFHIQTHFLKRLTRLDPEWSQNRQGNDMASNMILSHPSAQPDILKAQETHAIFNAQTEKEMLDRMTLQGDNLNKNKKRL